MVLNLKRGLRKSNIPFLKLCQMSLSSTKPLLAEGIICIHTDRSRVCVIFSNDLSTLKSTNLMDRVRAQCLKPTFKKNTETFLCNGNIWWYMYLQQYATQDPNLTFSLLRPKLIWKFIISKNFIVFVWTFLRLTPMSENDLALIITPKFSKRAKPLNVSTIIINLHFCSWTRSYVWQNSEQQKDNSSVCSSSAQSEKLKRLSDLI